MGEIIAKHDGLAREYAHILISYIRENGNYLENEVLQFGALWGIARAGEVLPDLVASAVPSLLPFLSSSNAGHRGLAARIMGLLRAPEARPELERLLEDEAELTIFIRGKPEQRKVGEMAKAALKALS
jgi:hypothetical protein